MTENFIRGTDTQIEDLHQRARAAYITAFAARFPNSRTRIARNYTDRITRIVADTVIQLSVDGKDHSDRFDDPIRHPNYPTTNEVIFKYDTDNESDDLETAFYYKSSERTNLGTDVALVEEDRATVESRGFFPASNEPN